MNSAEQFTSIAIKAARLGGKVLQEYYGKVPAESVQAKRLGDWVSSADKASEEAIVEFLKKETPDHDILTEEAGFIIGSRQSEFRWIIDPLDGTTNFLRGFHVWAVSIALEHRPSPALKWGSIISGAIYIPQLDDVYWASINHGAFCNGTRLELGDGRPFVESLLGTGFPFRTRDLVEPYCRLFSRILVQCADVRRAGAVAVDLCMVAAGTYDGFWELDLAPWDIAAGGLIIRESGGQTCNFQGGEDFLTTGDIIAGHPVIMPQLKEMVREVFPETRKVDKSPVLIHDD